MYSMSLYISLYLNMFMFCLYRNEINVCTFLFIIFTHHTDKEPSFRGRVSRIE